jgi:hypothetical protein
MSKPTVARRDEYRLHPVTLALSKARAMACRPAGGSDSR